MVFQDADLKQRAGLTSEDVKQVRLPHRNLLRPEHNARKHISMKSGIQSKPHVTKTGINTERSGMVRVSVSLSASPKICVTPPKHCLQFLMMLSNRSHCRRQHISGRPTAFKSFRLLSSRAGVHTPRYARRLPANFVLTELFCQVPHLGTKHSFVDVTNDFCLSTQPSRYSNRRTPFSGAGTASQRRRTTA